MHGWRSSWTNDFGMIADFWHDSGCSILFAEQRGQNNSGGQYMTFGHLERYDCLDWASWVTERTEGRLPVYLCGVSMGAATVLMTAGLELPASVHGIMADCGFTSPKDIISTVIKNTYHIPPQIIMPGMNFWAKILAKYSFDEVSTCDTLKKVRVPVLFIHGKADDFVPCYMTEKSFDACTGEKEVIYVENAGHGESYLTERERCESALKAFVEKELEKFESSL
jgi:fermentation-respiration switch protein FrsA (DUF1100 family)